MSAKKSGDDNAVKRSGAGSWSDFRLKVVRTQTKIDFLGQRRIWAIASGAAAVLSVLALVVFGLNFGIDFRGGTSVEAKFEKAVDLAEIRSTVGGLGLGDVAVQNFGGPDKVLIRVEEHTSKEELVAEVAEGAEVLAAAKKVEEALKAKFPVSDISTQTIGPKVSGELIRSGVIAVALAVLCVLGYIWIRFEWQFAVGAVAALVHDVLLTIGLFALLQLEFNLAIIAALLTIVGYSLNDTVVVFDRVRENLRRFKTTELTEVLNLSVNETLSRTIMTSLTTLLALLSLYFLGGEVIRGFTFAMIWGVVIGTYSSIFIASPILAQLGVERDPEGKDDSSAGVQFG